MEGHIWIDDVISPDYHLEVKRQLSALKGATSIVVHIQSPGGSVFGGYNTYHVLRSAGKPIKAIVEGEAQSIATFIALAADPGQLEIRNPSVWMIHNPWNEIQGDASDLEAGASELRNIQSELANAYASRSGIPVPQILEMMARTTSLTAQQAVQMKFADRIVEPVRAAALGKSINNMPQPTEKEMSFIATLIAKTAKAFGVGPKAANLSLADGTTLTIEGDAPYEGKAAMISGAPAPDGVYTLQDGGTITVAGGIVTATTAATSAAPQPPVQAPAAPPAPAPAPPTSAHAELESRIKALEDAAASSKAEAEASKAAAAKAETEKAAAEARAKDAEQKAQAGAVALGELTKEIEKFTVGNTSRPSAAATPRTPGSDGESINANQWAELLEEPSMLGVKNAMAMAPKK